MGLFSSIGNGIKNFANNLTGGAFSSGPKAPKIDELAFQDGNLVNNQKRLGGFIKGLQVGPTQLSPGVADTFRQGQEGLVGALQNRVAGTAPSVAETQLQQGQEANIKALMAGAGSARGAGAGLVARNLANNVAQSNLDTNAQAATLRAGEQVAAEQNLAQTLAGARTLDVQNQAQRDQLTAQYVQMGLTLDEAQFKANQDLERLKSGNTLGAQQNQNAAMQTAMKGASGLLDAGGSILGKLGLGK